MAGIVGDLGSGFKGSSTHLQDCCERRQRKGLLCRKIQKDGTAGDREGTNQELLRWVTKGLGHKPGHLFQKGPPLS